MTREEFLSIELNGGEIADAIIKFKGLGFLEDSINQTNDSIAYELLVRWLLNTDKEYDVELEVILFPVTHRIIKQYEDNIPIDIIKILILELFDTFPIKKYKEYSENHVKNNHHKRIDGEVSFLAGYCDNYPPLITI